MVIGKLKYLIELVRGHTSHRLDIVECESSHGSAFFRGSWTSVLKDGGPHP
jgi:hypothetical protein